MAVHVLEVQPCSGAKKGKGAGMLDDRAGSRSEWFHGSPARLTLLRAGSSITPFREIARAYSHKPEHLEISVMEDSASGSVHVEVTHDGVEPGFLYRVLVRDETGLRVPEENSGPLGEEMVTAGELGLKLIEVTEVTPRYSFQLKTT